MKFLVDAQLPHRLAQWFNASGHDAVHTLDLPAGNRTPDATLCTIADAEGRIMVTKDQDFVNAFFVDGVPERLLLVSTGNIRNVELEAIFQSSIPALESAFASHRYIELGRGRFIVHV